VPLADPVIVPEVVLDVVPLADPVVEPVVPVPPVERDAPACADPALLARHEVSSCMKWRLSSFTWERASP
jgi:hypothetical protein